MKSSVRRPALNIMKHKQTTTNTTETKQNKKNVGFACWIGTDAEKTPAKDEMLDASRKTKAKQQHGRGPPICRHEPAERLNIEQTDFSAQLFMSTSKYTYEKAVTNANYARAPQYVRYARLSNERIQLIASISIQ